MRATAITAQLRSVSRHEGEHQAMTHSSAVDQSWVAYDFAVLRVVPHVHIGAFVPVGVIVHARTTEFLGLRVLTDPDLLRSRTGEMDVELLVRYLESCDAICRGDEAMGERPRVCQRE